MTNKFVTKGYDSATLKQVGEEVAKTPRENLLKYEKKEKTQARDLMYISTYNTHAQLVRKSINSIWHVLQKDPRFVYCKGQSLANRQKIIVSHYYQKGYIPMYGVYTLYLHN